MKKDFWKSMTFWGAILLGVSTSLDHLGTFYPELMPYAKALGTFLTAFGIRRALN